MCKIFIVNVPTYHRRKPTENQGGTNKDFIKSHRIVSHNGNGQKSSANPTIKNKHLISRSLNIRAKNLNFIHPKRTVSVAITFLKSHSGKRGNVDIGLRGRDAHHNKIF